MKPLAPSPDAAAVPQRSFAAQPSSPCCPRTTRRWSTAAPALLAVLCVLAAAGCEDGRDERITQFDGTTMGTTYSVKVLDLPALIDAQALAEEIAATLERVNELMSTYREDSELSRFNRSSDTDWYSVSAETAAVVLASLEVSTLTGGAFDVTVGPLVNLWGFGPDIAEPQPPPQSAIAQVRERVGYGKLAVRDDPPALRKVRADLYVDLSAIAKGYAVDRVAELLEGHALADYLVEVGGELRAHGTNAAGEPWRVAVERPLIGQRVVQRVVPLANLAIATSGDYRNFYERDGRRYSHAIDPRSGSPVTHALASASVISDTTMRADALATALMVLGPSDGLAFAEREQVAALLLVREGENFVEQATSSLSRYLGED